MEGSKHQSFPEFVSHHLQLSKIVAICSVITFSENVFSDSCYLSWEGRRHPGLDGSCSLHHLFFRQDAFF